MCIYRAKWAKEPLDRVHHVEGPDGPFDLRLGKRALKL